MHRRRRRSVIGLPHTIVQLMALLRSVRTRQAVMLHDPLHACLANRRAAVACRYQSMSTPHPRRLPSALTHCRGSTALHPGLHFNLLPLEFIHRVLSAVHQALTTFLLDSNVSAFHLIARTLGLRNSSGQVREQRLYCRVTRACLKAMRHVAQVQPQGHLRARAPLGRALTFLRSASLSRFAFSFLSILALSDLSHEARFISHLEVYLTSHTVV